MPNIEKVRELQSKVMKDIAGGAIIPIMLIAEQFSQSSIKGIDLHE